MINVNNIYHDFPINVNIYDGNRYLSNICSCFWIFPDWLFYKYKTRTPNKNSLGRLI